jgi:hypothetical protein
MVKQKSRNATVPQHARGQKFAEQKSAGKGKRNAGDGRGRRRAPHPLDEPEIGLDARNQEQHEHTQFRNRTQHGPLGRLRRKQQGMGRRPERSENARSEDDAPKQLPHYRRLTDALHQVAQNAPEHDEQHHLGKEDQHGVVTVSQGGSHIYEMEHRGASGDGRAGMSAGLPAKSYNFNLHYFSARCFGCLGM